MKNNYHLHDIDVLAFIRVCVCKTFGAVYTIRGDLNAAKFANFYPKLAYVILYK